MNRRWLLPLVMTLSGCETMVYDQWVQDAAEACRRQQQGYADRARCINLKEENVCLLLGCQHMDLVRRRAGRHLALAIRLDAGEITRQDADQEMAQAVAGVLDELRQRDPSLVVEPPTTEKAPLQ